MANPINTFGAVKKLIAWGERAEKQGLDLSTDLQPSIDDPDQMFRIVECMVGNAMAARAAEAPLSGPVYDVRSVSDLLHVVGYTEEQISAMGPPPDALPGFVTFFDYGWSLLRLRRFCAKKDKIFLQQDWYDDEPFAKETNEPQYRQIRLAAIDGSFGKDFNEQQRLLLENEEVPSARVVVMGMVIHFLLSGQRLLEKYYVRCLDKSSGGDRVSVGGFDSGGFGVRSYWDNDRNGDLCLASSVPPRES